MSESHQELVAVPAEPGTEPSAATVVYSDVTSPGARKPILPDWMAGREAIRHAARHHGGHAWHAARYHGLRSPFYLLQVLFWALVGVFMILFKWVRWWLIPVPVEIWADSVSEGHRAWHRTHSVHISTTKTRAIISAVVILALVVSCELIWPPPWWAFVLAGLVLVPVLAYHGRPSGVKIVSSAQVPSEYEKLNLDVITRALGALGLAGINQWLRDGNRIDFVGPVRQDGPGWLADLNLPYGVTAGEVIDRRDKLASGLRRPLGAVWPEIVSAKHEGHLALWVGQQDVTARKPVPWPLLKAGAADVFKPVPFGTDVRGRKVSAPLIYHNWLIGSMPRNGKTAAVRELALAVALDPLCGLWIAELKGSGDLDQLERVSHRFVSGVDDESVGYAAQSLAELRRECERRAPKIKALPPDLCPDRKVTRQIAQRYASLRPLVCFIDEAQNLFAHPKYGKQAGIDAEFVIKIGPALGIVLILATQRPDKASLPTGVSANVSIRFCLYVAGQVENDMILGTSAYKNGLRATMFRPEIDAGLGWLKGAGPEPKVTRTHYLNVKDAAAIVARARVAREHAGTLTGVAVGQDASGPARDPLSDALAVFGADPGLHWDALAGRLPAAFPDRWAGATAKSVAAELQAAGVPSVTVTMAQQRARGCRKSDIETLTG